MNEPDSFVVGTNGAGESLLAAIVLFFEIPAAKSRLSKGTSSSVATQNNLIRSKRFFENELEDGLVTK